MSLTDLYKQFPDVHPNIILKTDVLRQGLRISGWNRVNRVDVMIRNERVLTYVKKNVSTGLS